MEKMEMRQILAHEIKKRGGPQTYIAMLGNCWMEVDSELPPELSSAIAAMRRVADNDLPTADDVKGIFCDNSTEDSHPF